MGILQAIGGAVGGAFGDQWKDIITAGHFDEHTALIPGERRNTDNGRGSNGHGSEGVITNGSKIYVPENTAAFIFSQSGIGTSSPSRAATNTMMVKTASSMAMASVIRFSNKSASASVTAVSRPITSRLPL